jgi:ABC-type transporter Mla subunit MlaD
MKRLASIAVAGILLAGCGGSSRMSKSAYEQRLQADGNAVQKSVTAVANTKSFADFAKNVDNAEAAVKKAADDLDALKPPADAEADNAAVVAALRRIQKGLEQVKANPTGAQAIVKQIESSPELKAAERATADLKKKGYKVGVIGAP